METTSSPIKKVHKKATSFPIRSCRVALEELVNCRLILSKLFTLLSIYAEGSRDNLE